MYVSTFDNEDRNLHSRSQGRKNSHKNGFSDHNVELEYFPGRKQEQEETVLNEQDLLNAASWELVEKPTYHGSVKAIISLPTLTLIVAYFCTFGTELAVNSFLGAYYLKTFPHLGQTGSGRWAAMYGLLNAIFRPLGGLMADIIYRTTGSLWGKKILTHSLAITMGVFMLTIGFVNPHNKATMMGLMTGLAFFEEAGNGSVFALLPHVHPTSNGKLTLLDQSQQWRAKKKIADNVRTGLITGVTGAAGNLGGIVYLLIARYNGTDYVKVFWIVGVANISASLLVAWIRPIPKGQRDAR